MPRLIVLSLQFCFHMRCVCLAEAINFFTVKAPWSNQNINIKFHQNLSKHTKDTCKYSVTPFSKTTLKNKLKWMIHNAIIILILYTCVQHARQLRELI